MLTKRKSNIPKVYESETEVQPIEAKLKKVFFLPKTQSRLVFQHWKLRRVGPKNNATKTRGVADLDGAFVGA